MDLRSRGSRFGAPTMAVVLLLARVIATRSGTVAAFAGGVAPGRSCPGTSTAAGPCPVVPSGTVNDVKYVSNNNDDRFGRASGTELGAFRFFGGDGGREQQQPNRRRRAGDGRRVGGGGGDDTPWGGLLLAWAGDSSGEGEDEQDKPAVTTPAEAVLSKSSDKLWMMQPKPSPSSLSSLSSSSSSVVDGYISETKVPADVNKKMTPAEAALARESALASGELSSLLTRTPSVAAAASAAASSAVVGGYADKKREEEESRKKKRGWRRSSASRRKARTRTEAKLRESVALMRESLPDLQSKDAFRRSVAEWKLRNYENKERRRLEELDRKETMENLKQGVETVGGAVMSAAEGVASFPGKAADFVDDTKKFIASATETIEKTVETAAAIPAKVEKTATDVQKSVTDSVEGVQKSVTEGVETVRAIPDSVNAVITESKVRLGLEKPPKPAPPKMPPPPAAQAQEQMEADAKQQRQQQVRAGANGARPGEDAVFSSWKSLVSSWTGGAGPSKTPAQKGGSLADDDGLEKEVEEALLMAEQALNAAGTSKKKQ